MRRITFLAVSTALMTLLGSATALAGYSPGGVHTPPTRVAGVVLKAPPHLGLAFTGGETIIPIAAIAAAMFALGAAALVASRRGRGSTNS